MPARNIITLAAAVVLALLAVIAAQTWLSSQSKAAGPAVATGSIPVVVAARPIARGATLAATDLKVVPFPPNAAPEGALNTIAQATAGQRMALRALAANEPVLASRVTAPGGKVSLSASMTPGMRAITFRSNDVSGVAGFVLPGDRVDVLLTRDTAGGSAGVNTTVTAAVADNLKVLGVDQVDDEATVKPMVAKAITLEATPEQAQAISLAQAVGSVSLSLRHVSDQAALTKRLTTVADLKAGRPVVATNIVRARAPQQRPEGLKVSVTRGVATTDYPVQR